MNEPDLPYCPATFLVHWPNQSVYMCDTHKRQAENIAGAMGFSLTSTPASGKECANCLNEALRNLKTLPSAPSPAASSSPDSDSESDLA